MKKITAFMLCLSLLAALCACTRGEAPASAPAAEKDAEEQSVYDAAAFEAAARAVREEFIQLIGSAPESFDEAAHPELPWYTAILTRFEQNNFYEAYYDFDGNGVPELLIGAGSEEGKTPIALYAFDGQSFRYLCKEHPLGERAYLSHKNDLFIVHASGGAAQGELVFYRIAPDGWSTEIVDVVDYLFSDAEHVSYSSQLGRIGEEEITDGGYDMAIGLDFEPEWSRFYPAA